MWPLIIFSGFLVLIIVTQECAGDEDGPCLSWNCVGKRWALQLANGDHGGVSRQILLRKLYEARRGNKEMKKSADVDAGDGPCLTWQCARKKRAVLPTSQQTTAEDPACLTEDCKAGRRSTLRTRSEGDDDSNALMQKLRFNRESTKSDPRCLAWHCSGKKRSSIEESRETDGSRQVSRQEESGLRNF